MGCGRRRWWSGNEAVAAEKKHLPKEAFLQPIHLQSEETSPSEPIIHCPSSPPDPRPSVQKSLCIIHRGTSDQPRTWDRGGPSLRNLNIAQWMHQGKVSHISKGRPLDAGIEILGKPCYHGSSWLCEFSIYEYYSSVLVSSGCSDTYSLRASFILV